MRLCTQEITQMALDQNSITPLYLQLCDLILSEIKNGKYQEGDKIPSELELCEQYHLSRTTIRAAIAALAKQDILVRRQGKGTYVKQQKPVLSLPPKKQPKSASVSSFSSGGFALESNSRLTSHISYKGLLPATKNDIMALGLRAEDLVFLYANNYFVNGKPAAIEEYFFHPKYAALEHFPLESESVWEILKNEFHISQISCSKKTIEIERSSKWVSSALRVNKGEPILVLRQTISGSDGVPILRIKESILGCIYKYVV
jgi:GntR family transcriptional regulator